MPIYEYCCEKCQNVFEEWTTKINDETSQTCPKCGSEAKRIMSNTSFVLKGGGWYVTDYGYRKGKPEESGSSAKHATSSSSSSGSSTSSAAPSSTEASSKSSSSTAPGKPTAGSAA